MEQVLTSKSWAILFDYLKAIAAEYNPALDSKHLLIGSVN